ncbi:YceI family protein [Aquimarina algiphila]|uniref:YceI family protein n=1 Tax=Aquimarina algiphila TaxID=2047982 RepID=UPI00249308F5|nr:YceI family protein [Aquimarina algiphila]
MKCIKKSILPISKIVFLCFTFYLISLSTTAQESTWQIDPNHSNINFGVSYFKVGEIKGVFKTYTGSFIQKKDEISTINITIQTASISTNQADRDKHLKTKDFFNAEKHPEIKFISTGITKTGDNEYEIKGNFTMTGVTKSIVLKAVDNGSYVHPRFKTENKFITVTGVIKREDFNVGTNYAPAKFALGSEVDLIAEIQLTKKK